MFIGAAFWRASTKPFEKDSQPGTILHEATHLLGAEDFGTYDIKP